MVSNTVDNQREELQSESFLKMPLRRQLDVRKSMIYGIKRSIIRNYYCEKSFFSLLITDPFMKATHALLKKMQLTHRISIQFQRIHKFPQTHGISD